MERHEIRSVHALYDGEFDEFSPITSDLRGDRFDGEFGSVVRRARRCLEGRTDVEVRYIAEYSDYLVSILVMSGRVVGVFADGSETTITAETADQLDERGLLKAICGLIRELIQGDKEKRHDVGFLDEAGQEICSIDRLKVSDILATHAIVQCVRATAFDFREWFAEVGSRHAMIAAECVAAAELEISHDVSNTANFRVMLRDVTRSAAEARWKKLEPARRHAIELYSAKKWRSRAEAVRTIAPVIMKMVEDAGQRLSPLNAEKTIHAWLKKSDRG